LLIDRRGGLRLRRRLGCRRLLVDRLLRHGRRGRRLLVDGLLRLLGIALGRLRGRLLILRLHGLLIAPLLALALGGTLLSHGGRLIRLGHGAHRARHDRLLGVACHLLRIDRYVELDARATCSVLRVPAGVECSEQFLSQLIADFKVALVIKLVGILLVVVEPQRHAVGLRGLLLRLRIHQERTGRGWTGWATA